MSMLWSRDVTTARTRICFVNITAKGDTLLMLYKRCANTLLLIGCRSAPVNIEGKAIKTTNSWSSCASIRCCEIFPRSSSRVLQGNGGSCSARSPSCFSLCRARGTSIPSDYSNRIDRNMPLQKRPISRCLSPFGVGTQQLLSPTQVSERVNKWRHPCLYTSSHVILARSAVRKRWLCRHLIFLTDIFYKCSLVKVVYISP